MQHAEVIADFRISRREAGLSHEDQQCQIKVVEISKLGKVPFVVEMFGKKTQAEFDVWDLELVEPVEDSCQKQKNQLSAKSG